MSSGRHIHIALPRLHALHARYVRIAQAGQAGALEKVARAARCSTWALERRFRAHGLAMLNIKPRSVFLPAAEVRRRHREYLGGMNLKALQKKYHRTGGDISRDFRALGLKVFPQGWNGTAWPRKTEAEIAVLIESVAARGRRAEGHTIKVPEEIKQEWKARWSLEQRADFIRRVRAAMALPNDAPTTPHSANVEPFDYGSARAWQIADAANAGRPSRHWRVRLFPSAQGMIWRDQLWFWIRDSGGRNRGCYQGAFVTKGECKNRPQLHREIYQAHVGPIPASHVVRFRDGNFNNLEPQNLYLQSRADEASENRRTVRVRQTRELTALLLRRHQRKQTHEHPHHQLVERLGDARQARVRKTARNKAVIARA